MDLGIVWDAQTMRGDWDVTSGDMAIDIGGLRSAVLVSFFTDRAAPPDYQPPAGTPYERRGVWVDSYETEPAGSWLWLLNRVKKTPTLLNTAANYASDSVQWLVRANIASSVTVQAMWLQPTVIGLQPTIIRPRSPPFVETYGWAWQGIS